MSFTYDAAGTPLTVTYNGTKYYYNTNLQGDVVGILDSSGAKVVSYIYDAWGRPYSTTGSMASTLGADNPLRYRGYVYDSETWFYYLQSRYYSFEWGKFISADAFVSTGQGFVGNNMFAYCLNNPVCRKDISGTTDVDILDDGDSNLLDDDKTFAGSKMSNGSSGSGGSGIKNSKLNFKSESALYEHYEKHNPEFGNAFSTPQEYVDAANYVIESGEYIGSQNAYVKFYGMNGFANYAFVGLSHDHSFITTFHLKYVSQIKF